MRVIKPTVIRPARVETLQCEADVLLSPSESWRMERYKRLRPNYNPLKCQKPSVIEIDGHCYCRSHAGAIALEKWIIGDLVETKDDVAPDD